MKRSIVLVMALTLGLTVLNCKKDVTPSYKVDVTLAFPQGFTLASMPTGVEIKITNAETGRETVILGDASGKVSVILVEGKYSVKCNFSVKVGSDEYFFNGVQNNVVLTKDGPINMDLVLAKNSGGFILKEIYYAGSKTPDAKSYASDQFHEIYNNSNDTLFADGLCIGCLQQIASSPNVWLKTDGTVMDELPIIFQAWMIPGTGKEHPVYPGKSLVIAQDGINHITDPNGNPSSPANLANAQWESYVDNGKDLDAPGVPNLTLMYTTAPLMTDWSVNVNGYATIIFRLPTGTDWQTYANNANNFKTAPNSTATTKYFMINKSNVVDAVELVYADETKRYKRLPDTLDAGYTYLDAGSYSSKSVRRKANMIVGGRVIYKDTNNSTADFLHDVTPTPGVNPTVVEK